MSLLITISLLVAVQEPAPADLDAVAAAPRNHKVLLENDRVRVLQVEVAPGETEAVHEHRWSSVIHIQSWQPGIDIQYEVRGGKLVETGQFALPAGAPPPAIWVPREQPHSVKNMGSQPFRLLRVELKGPPLAGDR